MRGYGRPFVKGHHVGRKKGSKGKLHLNLEYWIMRLNQEYDKLTPIQRAKISLEAFKALLSKMPSLPTSPADSLKNTEEMLSLIKSLESDKLNDVKTETKSLAEVDITLSQLNSIAKMSETDDIPKSGLSEEAKAVIESPTKTSLEQDINPEPKPNL